MSGKRLGFILGLIAVFVAGVFVINKFVYPVVEGNNKGDSATIRGVVETTLPSGKIIQVRQEDGTEALLSLSDAYLITNEAGEDLLYQDVKPGMALSAAGIRGVEGNVIIPSLVTVQWAHAAKGEWVVRMPSLQYQYFLLRYDESLWKAVNETTLEYRAAPGCTLAAKPPEAINSSWTKSTTERKIGDNVFDDSRYTEKGEQRLRVLTLENPGDRYEAGEERSLAFPADFTVTYGPSIAGPALLECVKAVDSVLASFLLQNASRTIVVIEPSIPIKAEAGSGITVRGAAHSPDGLIYITAVNETGKKVVSKVARIDYSSGGRFGQFAAEIYIPQSAGPRLRLQVFHYGGANGAITGLVSLPLGVE